MKRLETRQLSPSAQDALRQRVIQAVRGGMSQAHAARIFGVSRRSVNGWHRRWRTHGARALWSRPRGRPSAIQLAPWQAATLVRVLTNRGKLAFMVFRGRFTAVVFIGFLHRLVRQRHRKVFVIVDRHPVHIAEEVAVWVQRRKRRIRLYFLPGYSPQLNPDEPLNQDVKTNAVGRQRPRTQRELVGNVRRFLWRTQHQPQKIRGYFRHPSVCYAA